MCVFYFFVLLCYRYKLGGLFCEKLCSVVINKIVGVVEVDIEGCFVFGYWFFVIVEDFDFEFLGQVDDFFELCVQFCCCSGFGCVFKLVV